jgi:predicted hydrolase (HD superfamily)
MPRTTDLAHTVYACDEMTGFLVAVALVRPGRSLAEVDVAAVRRKMKDKGFARQVPRDQLEGGAAELDVPFDEHVENVLAGLRPIAAELGL